MLEMCPYFDGKFSSSRFSNPISVLAKTKIQIMAFAGNIKVNMFVSQSGT